MGGLAPAAGNFVPYLPQDNAETPEAEELVASLLAELDGLLRSPPAQFWQAVRSANALPQFLGTYLQFCRRPHDTGSGAADPPASRLQLARDVFLLLLRLVSDESAAGGIPRQEQGRILYGQQLLDVPKLLDIATLYGRGNPELTRDLFAKALSLEPRLASDLKGAMSVICANLAEVHGTCAGAARQLGSGSTPALLQGILDGLAYLTDACHTLAALTEAHPPAARLLLRQPQLPPLLHALHDKLLPAAAAALRNEPTADQQAQPALGGLQAAAGRLHGALLLRGCLQAEQQARAAAQAAQRGADLQTLLLGAGGQAGGLARLAQQRMGLSRLIAAALDQGHVQLDRLARDRLFEALGDAAAASQAGASDSAQAAARREQLAQIREVLPGYGDGFLAACLDAAGGDATRVVTQLLEGSLPEELRRLDPQMPLSEPQPNGAAALQPAGSSRGNGSAGPAAPPATRPAGQQKPATVHKGTAFALRATPQEAAVAKLRALAAQWEEYEDEYDDTWDDGTFDADSSADTRGDRLEAAPAPSGSAAAAVPHTQPKGGKPLWVLGGRVYNYRKEGATPVPNQAAADEEARAQRAAEANIHGLGAGGNKPAAPPEPGSSQPGGGRGEGPSDGGRGAGGGRGRGRGRAGPSDTRRAHLFKTEHKAALGNHHRKDRALRKQGGPAS